MSFITNERWRHRITIIFIILIIVFIISFIISVLYWYIEGARRKVSELPFKEGQVMTRVIDGTKVQILDVDPFDSKWSYQVRLSNGQIIWIKAYEITK